MLIITLPLKTVQESKMGGGSYLTPDFGGVVVKSWGKCAEDAPEGFMTLWVECDENAEMQLKNFTGFKAEIVAEKTDKDLLTKCEQAIG